MTFEVNDPRLSKLDFAALYDEHFDYLLRFILPRVAGNRQTAEDLLQETFLAVLRSPDFAGRSKVRTWITSIARNKIADHYRRLIRQQDWFEADGCHTVAPAKSAEDLFTESEDREAIIAALDRLNPVYRWTLVMKYIDGYSMKEIGHTLGRTPKAVDSILQRARSAFAKGYLEQNKGGSNDEE
jgi:RNA polymerase sigma-70 factor (ECF subfamily)